MTNPNIAKAIALAGGPSAVYRHFQTGSPWVCSKWRKSLPPERVIPLAALVGFKYTPHQLAPDLYPYPDDGIPPNLRDKL